MTLFRAPRGPAKIAFGSGVLALSQLAVVAIAGRTSSVEDLGLYLTWFMAANLAGLLFTVLESLVPQSLLVQPDSTSRRRALARWSQGTAVALIPLSLLVVGADFLAPGVLDGSQTLLVLLLIYVAISAGQSLIRGQATAEQDFGTFLYLMSADGIVRVAAAVMAGILAPTASGFALGTCVGAASGLLVGWARTRSAWGIHRARESVTSARTLVQTSWSTTSATVLNNGLVPWLAFLGTVSAAAIASFSTAQTLSRAPMLAIAALYAPLIAPLARYSQSGHWAEYRSILVRVMTAAGAAGIAFTLLLTFAGNEIINIFLGTEVSQTPRSVFALLGVATLGLLVTAPAQAALAARGEWSTIAWSWSGAMLALAATLALPVDPIARAAGSAAAAAALAALLMGDFAMRHPTPRVTANDPS